MQDSLSEPNIPSSYEPNTAVGMSAGSTTHDISVQPGPSSFYSQTASASVETETTPAITKPTDYASVEQPRKKKKVKYRIVNCIDSLSAILPYV
jgi:hypothetical protein